MSPNELLSQGTAELVRTVWMGRGYDCCRDEDKVFKLSNSIRREKPHGFHSCLLQTLHTLIKAQAEKYLIYMTFPSNKHVSPLKSVQSMNRKEKWVKHLIGLVLTARGEKKMDLGWCPIVLSVCWPSAEGGNGVRQLSIYRGEQQRRLSGKQLRWQSVRPQDFHQRLLRRGTAQDGVVGCGLVKPQRIHFNVWGNFKTSIYSQSLGCVHYRSQTHSHTLIHKTTKSLCVEQTGLWDTG